MVLIDRLRRRLRRADPLADKPEPQVHHPTGPPSPSPQHPAPREQKSSAVIDTAAAFHALVEGIREGAAILALDLTVLTCNRRLAEMLKLECERVMGRPISQFIPPEDLPAFERLLASASEGYQRIHLRLSGANFFPLPVDLAIRRLDVGSGPVFSLLATDLSRRRRAEEQIAFQSHLLANVSDAVLSMDEHFRLTYWNAAAERLYGWRADEVLGRTVSEVIHPDLSPEQLKELNEQLAETGLFDNETFHRRKYGALALVEARRTALRAPDGHMIGYISVNRDITERRRAEETLREAMEEIRRLNAELEQRVVERTRELDAERARWQGVVEGIADEVWVADAQGKMGLINLPEVTAMGLEEFTDKTVAEVYEEVDILNLDGQLRPLEEAPLLRALQGQIVRGEEIMRHRQTGRTRFRQFSAAPTRDATGVITGAVAIVRDVTDYKRADQEIVRLNETLAQRAAELEAANRELESFSYSVSHDLGTPLGAILAFVRTAQKDHAGQLPADLAHYLSMIETNAEHTDQLIHALLRFSRVSQQPLKKEQVNVRALTEEVWQELEPQRQGRQVELAIGALPEAEADPVLLKQVLANLLSNALKFTRPRQVAQIEIDWYQRNGDTVYVVRDNGVGFNPDHAEKLFGVFQRLHSEDEFEGTGIGPALVERIVRRHGGYVCADAVPGEGAAFYLTLAGRKEQGETQGQSHLTPTT